VDAAVGHPNFGRMIGRICRGPVPAVRDTDDASLPRGATMKYAMLICGDDDEWTALSPADEQDVMKQVYA
jgi:hypothetical protein